MSYDIVYLSAITLSIYDAAGRERLFAAIKRRAPARHPLRVRHQFPRPGLARSRVAREVFAAAFATADIVLTSTEDLLRSIPAKATSS